MIPRDTVPDSTGMRVHKAGTFVDGAVDVYAPAGSEVRAPGRGRVVDAMPSPAVAGSWEIRGYIERRDGKLVPFVAAHFTEDSHLEAGDTFEKGEVIGRIRRWDAEPPSTHVHWAFRRVGDPRLPPPGNVLVLGAFLKFGRMPAQRS